MACEVFLKVEREAPNLDNARLRVTARIRLSWRRLISSKADGHCTGEWVAQRLQETAECAPSKVSHIWHRFSLRIIDFIPSLFSLSEPFCFECRIRSVLLWGSQRWSSLNGRLCLHSVIFDTSVGLLGSCFISKLQGDSLLHRGFKKGAGLKVGSVLDWIGAQNLPR